MIAPRDKPSQLNQLVSFVAERLQQLTRFVDECVRLAAAFLNTQQRRVGHLPESRIFPDPLPQLGRIARHVQQVIRNLERQTNTFSELFQPMDKFRVGLRDPSTERDGRTQQPPGLTPMNRFELGEG